MPEFTGHDQQANPHKRLASALRARYWNDLKSEAGSDLP